MEVGNLVAELGGGAAAAILLTWVLNQAFAINPRFLPLTAMVSGWGLSLAITVASNAQQQFSNPLATLPPEVRAYV